jgi:hypothetical protein
LEQLDTIAEDANGEDEINTEQNDHNFSVITKVIENQNVKDKNTLMPTESRDQIAISFAHELYSSI